MGGGGGRRGNVECNIIRDLKYHICHSLFNHYILTLLLLESEIISMSQARSECFEIFLDSVCVWGGGGGNIWYALKF